MNSAEHLVELYYQQKGYLTTVDIKIEEGNNRQFDLLAYDLKEAKILHIEINVSITHEKNHNDYWGYNKNKIKKYFKEKFFGHLKPNKTGDEEKNLIVIKKTYNKFGIEYKKVTRVICIWCLPPEVKETPSQWKKELSEEFELPQNKFEILSFRDEVLPELFKNIKTSNYNDELLRLLSLLKAANINKNEKYEEKLEDLFDAIIAESRKDEESVSWEDVKKRLKKKGKI